MSNWKYPVQPIMTDALIREWVEKHHADGPKPTAFDTPLRFSSAGDCARALAYQALGEPATNGFDAPSIWVTGLGTIIHEMVQEAIGRRFPGAIFEPKGKIGNIASGHADGVVDGDTITAVIPDWNGGKALYELKTMGGMAFEKSIGLKRRSRTTENPEGPRISALLQSALNAYVHDCDTLIIGSISLEPISRGLGAGANLDEIGRFIAEWHIPKSVWSVWAQTEFDRQSNIVESAQKGWLPQPSIVEDVTDEGLLYRNIDPTSARPYWKCDYCAYKELCISEGAGIVERQ